MSATGMFSCIRNIQLSLLFSFLNLCFHGKYGCIFPLMIPADIHYHLERKAPGFSHGEYQVLDSITLY